MTSGKGFKLSDPLTVREGAISVIGHVTESESLYASNPGYVFWEGRTHLSVYRAVPLLRNT